MNFGIPQQKIQLQALVYYPIAVIEKKNNNKKETAHNKTGTFKADTVKTKR